MVDIALIHPQGSNWLPDLEGAVNSSNRMPPIGMMMLSAYLKRSGFSVQLFDLCANLQDIDKAIVDILAAKPAFAGFSCTTSSFYDGYYIAQKIKESSPDTKIVFGGVHVSSQRQKVLDEFPEIDFAIVGEGEETLHGLVSGTAPEDVPGLIFRRGDRICFNGYRKDPLDLDMLPFPDYKGLPDFPKGYNLPLFNYPHAPNTTMITSRGCPYQCVFCDRSVYRRGFRFNSARYIFEHLTYLKTDYSIRHINIYDDLFTYDRNRIMTLSEILQKKKLKISFNCCLRYDTVDDEILVALKKAGCWMISLGIESGDVDVLKINKANVDLDGMKATILKIKKHKLRVKGLFMLGLPGESEQSIENTKNLMLSLPLDDINISKFTPFPGSPIYSILGKYGEFEENWKKMNCMNFTFKPSAIESLERLDALYSKVIVEYYERPSILLNYVKMLWISPHSWYCLLQNLPHFLTARRHFRESLG